jgi:hypothetical protein
MRFIKSLEKEALEECECPELLIVTVVNLMRHSFRPAEDSTVLKIHWDSETDCTVLEMSLEESDETH